MRQRITTEQFQYLSEVGVEKLYDWLIERHYIQPAGMGMSTLIPKKDRLLAFKIRGYLLTIGQMIEILYMYGTVIIESEDYEGPLRGWIIDRTHTRLELVDALWEKVRDRLK